MRILWELSLCFLHFAVSLSGPYINVRISCRTSGWYWIRVGPCRVVDGAHIVTSRERSASLAARDSAKRNRPRATCTAAYGRADTAISQSARRPQFQSQSRRRFSLCSAHLSCVCSRTHDGIVALLNVNRFAVGYQFGSFLFMRTRVVVELPNLTC